MDISPVSFDQIKLGQDGREYEISGWASDIARQLHELDPTLRVRFNESGMFFAVQQVVDAGMQAVTVEGDSTQRVCVMRVPADEWGPKVVREFEMRAHEVRHGISAAERLDRLHDEHQRARDHEFDEMVRERAYPLFRSFQRNLVGANPRAFIAGRRTAGGYVKAA